MIIFTDAFTVGADTNINAYPTVPDYSMAKGAATDIKVVAATGRATTQPTSVDAMARMLSGPIPTGDQQITGDVNDAGAGDVGIVGARVAAATADYYACYVDGSVANEVRVDRWDAGVGTNVLSVDRGIGVGPLSHSIRFKLIGTNPVNLEVQVDTTAVATVADSAANRKQSGRPGVGGFSAVGSAWVDNVVVDNLASVMEIPPARIRSAGGVLMRQPLPRLFVVPSVPAVVGGAIVEALATGASWAVGAAAGNALRGASASGTSWSVASAARNAIRGLVSRAVSWSTAGAAAGVIRALAARAVSWSIAKSAGGVLRQALATAMSWSIGAALANRFKGLTASSTSWSVAKVAGAAIRALKATATSWTPSAARAGAIRPRAATSATWSIAKASGARLVSLQSAGATWSISKTPATMSRGLVAIGESWTVGNVRLSANRAIRASGATWSWGNGFLTPGIGAAAGRPPYDAVTQHSPGASVSAAPGVAIPSGGPNATVGSAPSAVVTSGGNARLT